MGLMARLFGERDSGDKGGSAIQRPNDPRIRSTSTRVRKRYTKDGVTSSGKVACTWAGMLVGRAGGRASACPP